MFARLMENHSHPFVSRRVGGHFSTLSALLLLGTAVGCSDKTPEQPSAASAQTEVKTAESLAPAQTVADLATICQSSLVQDIAAKLSTQPSIQLSTQVTVKDVPNGPKFDGGARLVPAKGEVPAFCQITGSFVTNPETGKTANFLATLPANWNGKYLQIGCSGHCGQFAVSDPAQPFATITLQGYPFQTIIKGYASFATDEGHEGYSGSQWAIKGPGEVDEEAITDFYYRAHKVLTGVGKEFTKTFYSEALKSEQDIDRAYFSGCSGGGRDAFVAASYFPEEFDGIIGGSAYNLSGVAMHWAGLSVAQLQSPEAQMTPEQVALIDPIVKAKCDKVDGVADGLIQNPAACDFRPEVDLPKCEEGKASNQCFTQAQINVLSTLLTAVTDENGNVVQPGFSVSELLPGFLSPATAEDYTADEPWPDAHSKPATPQGGGMWDLPNSVIKVFAHKNDPDFHTRSLYSFTSGGEGQVTGYRAVIKREDVDAINAATVQGVGHFPEKAQKLIEQNRKFLIWHNLSDEKLTPFMAFNYYNQLAKLYGGYAKVQDNIRLFSLPGTSHCSMSGVGPTHFDALGALEDWVEKDVAPNALKAELYHSNAYGMADFSKPPSRTMPLCKYPEMARYKGQGDVNDAANWTCPEGDTGMLQVGESGRQAGVIQ